VRLYSGYSPYFPDNAEIDEKAGAKKISWRQRFSQAGYLRLFRLK